MLVTSGLPLARSYSPPLPLSLSLSLSLSVSKLGLRFLLSAVDAAASLLQLQVHFACHAQLVAHISCILFGAHRKEEVAKVAGESRAHS